MSYISEEVKAQIGVLGEVQTAPNPLGLDTLRRFTQAVMESNPMHWERAAAADLGFDAPVATPLQPLHLFPRPAGTPDPFENKAVVYGLLFDLAAETLIRIAADPKHLGASIGATLVLHTWGSALTHHPHVHGIVPGGGLASDGRHWVACRPGFFLSVRVLSRLFRRRFLEELLRVHQAGKLQFFGEHAALADATAFKAWLAPLRQCEWVVYAKRPFAGPQAVLAYLSHYTHRVAIAMRWSSCKPSRAVLRSVHRLCGLFDDHHVRSKPDAGAAGGAAGCTAAKPEHFATSQKIGELALLAALRSWCRPKCWRPPANRWTAGRR